MILDGIEMLKGDNEVYYQVTISCKPTRCVVEHMTMKELAAYILGMSKSMGAGYEYRITVTDGDPLLGFRKRLEANNAT